MALTKDDGGGSPVKFKSKDELPPSYTNKTKGMGGKRKNTDNTGFEIPAWLRRFWESMSARAEKVNLAPPVTPQGNQAYTPVTGGAYGGVPAGWKPPATQLSYLQAANATPGAYTYNPYTPYQPQSLGIAGYPYLGTYREGYMGRVGGTWLPGAQWENGKWNTMPNAPYYPAPQAYGPPGQLKMFTWPTPEVIQEPPPGNGMNNLGENYGGGRLGNKVSYGGGRRGGGGGGEYAPSYRGSQQPYYRSSLPSQPNIPRWLQAMVNWRIRG